MKIIVACDLQNGVGFKDKLPWHIPADLNHFKTSTYGSAVIMGSRTARSILSYTKNPKILSGRRCLVMSRDPSAFPGVEVFTSLSDLLKVEELSSAWVIGGVQIYELLLPYCDEVHLTRINGTYDCDKFFNRYLDTFHKVKEMPFPNEERCTLEIWRPIN